MKPKVKKMLEEREQIQALKVKENAPTGRNIIRKRVGNQMLSVEEDEHPHEGVVYSDFNVNQLLEAGATDLLKNYSMLQPNDIDTIDKISALDAELGDIIDQPVQTPKEEEEDK